MPAQLESILDVAVVMSALYVALSCACSFVNEQIASVLSWRGKHLYLGVLNLLCDAEPLAKTIFAHPLIVSASNTKGGVYRPMTDNRPSYVEARNFSIAFWHSIQSGGGQAEWAPPSAGALQATAAANALVTEPQAIVAALRQAASTLPSSDLKVNVSALLAQAGDDYEALLQTTDAWFNSQMDRVSGWYRRKTQFVLIAIAAVVVIATGLDSIEIASKLYFTPVALASAAATVQSQFPGGEASAERIAAATNALVSSETMQQFFHPPIDIRSLQTHALGMLATLIALSLGSPFWFDALAKLVNVRMAGSKPGAKPTP
jgi:hypothetical protein